ncbi:NAD(P)/FAD-dependent oxidoreductase [Candidatus Woesearchaeota archaeon]|nr:NAD(P)/FAD-dependent oxidoreductase [Candidatus Woesearchaeota archaeon]
MLDVIIIGHGPAGLSAAIFAARAGLRTLVIGNPANSQLTYAKNIQNYFGFPEGVDGSVLVEKGIKQAKNCGARIMNGEVVDCVKRNKVFLVKTADGRKRGAKSVVIATGMPIQWAGVKNEKELLGKGVHTCASCDGPLYRNKKIAVIGHGNHAAEDALELTSYTKDITIISNNGKFEFAKRFRQQLKKHGIRLKLARVDEFKASTFLKGLVFEHGKSEAYDAAFLACGVASSLTFASKLGVEIKENLLVADENGMTSIAGVFAAGNCMGRCRQIAKNVGDGCNAGISVVRYLKAKDIYFDYAKE